MFSKKYFKASSLLRRLPIVIVLLIVAVIGITLAVNRQAKSNDIKSTAISVQGDTANTPDVLSVSPDNKNLDYTSPAFKAAYEFNAIAPNWKESEASETNREVMLRISLDGKEWSEWAHIEAMRPQKDDAPHADRVFPEAPIITLGKYFQYKVELRQEGDKSPKIEDMNVTYIDSRPSAAKKISNAIRSFFLPNASAANQTPGVISRAAWGSPDPEGKSLRGTDLHWPPTYSPTKQIFIHHTVTSDYSSHTDGPAVVRAIWEYHARTLGWGDIGYNYLVDQSGKTYQGRAHGDNVTGGHTFEYNRGSMAVALIGCFQPNNSTCQQLNSNTAKAPSSSMLDSLTTLLAWNTTNFEIDPQGQQTFCKSDGVSGCLSLFNISSHRNANQTSCPGDLAYQELQTIRNTTATKKANGFYYSAKQVNYPTVSLGNNSELSVTLQYKNTGTATWFNTGANPVNLATANSTDHTSPFQGSGWLNSARPATLTESTVPPGGTGSFTFKVANPAGYLNGWHEYFGLVAEGNTHFGNHFGLPITTRNFSYSYSSQQAYKDNTKTTAIDLSNLSPGQTAWLVLKVTNTSNVSWSNTGSSPINLGTGGPQDRHSRFCTSAWPNCTRAAKLTESSVAPGAIGSFEFPINVPAGGGSFNEYFTPLAEGLTWMEDIGIHYPISVNDIYSWSFVGQAAYTNSSKTAAADLNNLSPGQTFFFSVIAKNTGNTIWYNSGSYPLVMGTSRPKDRISTFYNASWLLPNRVARMTEQSVLPGQNGTFEGLFTTPAVNGNFKEYLQPVAEGITWLNDIGLHAPVTINANYSWDFVDQQAFTDDTQTTPLDTSQLAPGQRFYFVVTAKNTGNATWYKSGTYPLRLGTSKPNDRTSLFYDNNWLAANRPGVLSEASVPPGGNGHFGGYYTAPNQTGLYKEYLKPVAEGVAWLNDVGLYIPAIVN